MDPNTVIIMLATHLICSGGLYYLIGRGMPPRSGLRLWSAGGVLFGSAYIARMVAGRDIEATRRACAKFREIPVAIMNFVEGTRFTPAKHGRQQSPYRHLLKPKSGGVAFVLDTMGDGLHGILDVTIAYPAGRPSMVDLIGNRIPEVRVQVRQRPIPAALIGGNYQDDRAFRARFQQWMNGLWEEKDRDLDAMLAPAASTVERA